MPRPGSNATIRTCSPPRCSTASRWASMRRRRSCATPRAWRRGAAGRHQLSPTGMHAGARRGGVRAAASAPCGHARRRPRHPCAAAGLARRSADFREEHGAQDRNSARRGISIPCAISGCAPSCRPPRLERLARADAFRSLGLDRRDALWAVRALQRSGDKDDLPLFARVHMHELEPDVALPPMRPGEHVIEDYRILHLSLKAHPLAFLRPELDGTRHSAARTTADDLLRAASSRSPAWCWCASARATPRRSS